MSAPLNTVLLAFGLSPATTVTPITTGHLNQTFCVKTPEGTFIVQKMNTHIFPSISTLMNNIAIYNQYKKTGLIDCPEYLKLSQTNTSNPFIFSDNNESYRAYPWIEGQSFKQVKTTDQAYSCGLAYGLFNASALHVPIDQIQPVIPDFFNLAQRLNTLDLIVKNCKDKQRLQAITPLLKSIQSLKHSLLEAYYTGEKSQLPKRCIHADTKPSNVLLSAAPKKPAGVIDLDTLSAYYWYYDFSDGARSTANESSEDSLKAGINLDLLFAFSQGFLEPLQQHMTQAEQESLVTTLPLISYMLCVRFATDYCDQDRYFRVSDPEHNLRRTQAQYQITQHLMSSAAIDCVKQAIWA